MKEQSDVCMPPHATRAASCGGLWPAMDLVRFSAAVLVMLFHFTYWFPKGCNCLQTSVPGAARPLWWGWIGVQIFFVVSGVLIALSAENRSALAFARGRFLRLAPGLWVFATLSAAVLIASGEVTLADGVWLYVKSLVLFPRGPWVDGVYWSLTIEVLFYALMFALLLMGRFSALGGLVKWWTGLSAVFAALTVMAAAGVLPTHTASAISSLADLYASRYFLLVTGPYFCVGLALYFLYRHGPARQWLTVLGVAFAASEISIYFWTLREIPVAALNVSPAVPMAIFALSVAIIAASLFWLKPRARGDGRRSTRILHTLGLSSYPVYLVHFVAGRAAWEGLLAAGLPPLPAMLLVMAGCLAVSFAFVTHIEPRVRRALAMTWDGLAARLKAGRKWLLAVQRPARVPRLHGEASGHT